ncbi:MAG: hypothetical protein ACTSW1_05135 [Candidatus Hodarchaeales archaeon]
MVAPVVKKKKEWLLITTSRNPSHALRRAANVLYYSIPGSIKINRGSMNFNSILSFCWRNSLERILVLNNSSEVGIFRVKAFQLEDKVISLSIRIELTEVINVKKHDPSTRIDIRGIKIVNEKETDSFLCKKVIDFFRPGEVYFQDSVRELQLRIKSKNSHYACCYAFQVDTTNKLRLFLLKFKEDYKEF